MSIVLAAPVKASTSPTTAGDPFWIGVGVVGWTIVMSTVLAVSFGIAAVVRSRLAPRQTERVLAVAVAVLLGLGAVAGLLRAAYPQPEGPTPAPTAPGSGSALLHSWSE